MTASGTGCLARRSSRASVALGHPRQPLLRCSTANIYVGVPCRDLRPSWPSRRQGARDAVLRVYNEAMDATRRLSPLDRVLAEFEHALRTAVASSTHAAKRPSPAAAIPASELSAAERVEAGRLMRVNHAGEIAAQALYQGQAFMARGPEVREAMARSSAEEVDHLAWC